MFHIVPFSSVSGEDLHYGHCCQEDKQRKTIIAQTLQQQNVKLKNKQTFSDKELAETSSDKCLKTTTQNFPLTFTNLPYGTRVCRNEI